MICDAGGGTVVRTSLRPLNSTYLILIHKGLSRVQNYWSIVES